jgi:Kazal-type serine protease inhibitor domain
MHLRMILLLTMILGAAACGDDGASDDGGSKATCGGHAGNGCPENEFCDYPTDRCGAADGTGLCRSQPNGCSDNYLPVKGSDGETYGNECYAHASGVDSCGPA